MIEYNQTIVSANYSYKASYYFLIPSILFIVLYPTVSTGAVSCKIG